MEDTKPQFIEKPTAAAEVAPNQEQGTRTMLLKDFELKLLENK